MYTDNPYNEFVRSQEYSPFKDMYEGTFESVHHPLNCLYLLKHSNDLPCARILDSDVIVRCRESLTSGSREFGKRESKISAFNYRSFKAIIIGFRAHLDYN